MKAKIIKTGEIIDFKGSSTEFGTCTWIDSKNILHQGYMPDGGIEILEDKSDDIDWEKRRYELVKSAMNGILSNSKWDKISKLGFYKSNVIGNAVSYADEMIKQLKGNDN